MTIVKVLEMENNDSVITLDDENDRIQDFLVDNSTSKKKQTIEYEKMFGKDCIYIFVVLIVILLYVYAFFIIRLDNYLENDYSEHFQNLYMFLIVLIFLLVLHGTQPPEPQQHGNTKVYVRNRRSNRVVRMRVAKRDYYYVEVDLGATSISYNELIKLCCRELKIHIRDIAFLSKSSTTLIRNDADVRRFNQLELIDVFLKSI